MAKQQLNSEERAFFHLLAEVIFSNPFSYERDQVESLLGMSPTYQADEHHYNVVVPILQERLQNLEKRGVDNICALQGEDRTFLEYAYLFEVYYMFVHAFDELIERQLSQGDAPAEVPFAKDLIQKLMRRKFSEAEALRYLALFYQIRRAYFFIDQSLIGEAESMRQLRHALWNNVFTTDVRLYARHLWDRMEDFSTLLLGETGTGKGSAAAAIGRSGLIPYDEKAGCFKYSFTSTFVAINLSEFPESLMESELFGHRKGAFTGAIDNHKGLFERCSTHGALFLVEIGDVSVPVQIKLLNVLQERRFTPVGSHERRRFQGRVIAATNRRIEDLRQQGQFRDDFYYRLSSDVIKVPSLRRRLEESPAELEQLVILLVQRLTGDNVAMLVEQVMQALKENLPKNYPWPGNVRELEQAVRRILLNGEYSGEAYSRLSPTDWVKQIPSGKLTAQELLSAYCDMLYRQVGTYEEVASLTGLDRRTAKKYIDLAKKQSVHGSNLTSNNVSV